MAIRSYMRVGGNIISAFSELLCVQAIRIIFDGSLGHVYDI